MKKIVELSRQYVLHKTDGDSKKIEIFGELVD